MNIIQDQKYYRDAGRMIFNDTVKDNVNIMMASSECRKKLMKEADTLGEWEIISLLSETLSDLVGDTVFRNKMRTVIERRSL